MKSPTVWPRSVGLPRPARAPSIASTAAPKYTNRLFLEPSPYLLQHAHNPVNQAACFALYRLRELDTTWTVD